jgi:hypothetical protein
MKQAQSIAKALVALVTAFVFTAAAYTTTDGELSGVEILISLASALGSGAIVWKVPNKPTDTPTVHVNTSETRWPRS